MTGGVSVRTQNAVEFAKSMIQRLEVVHRHWIDQRSETDTDGLEKPEERFAIPGSALNQILCYHSLLKGSSEFD